MGHSLRNLTHGMRSEKDSEETEVTPGTNKCTHSLTASLQNGANNHDCRSRENSKASSHSISEIWHNRQDSNAAHPLYNSQ